ncbi:unnamed protein product [Heterobilharzia americana]|nr:unnamed protein product [Heterobilharzia americana]
MEDKTKSCASNATSSDKNKVRRRRNYHSKVITSTPLNEGSCHQNNSSITKESGTFPSITERLPSVLGKISSLEHKWSKNVHQSCIIFTNLATHICKILLGSLSVNDLDDCITYTLCDLYLNQNVEQTKKLRVGQILETGYDKLDEHLTSMENCCTQLNSLVNQFNALSKLDQNESLCHYATCYSKSYSSLNTQKNYSMPEDTSLLSNSVQSPRPLSSRQSQQYNQLFLWEPFRAELNGLINQIERDLTIRRHLTKIILPHSLQTHGSGSTGDNDNILRLVSLWRHMGQYVTWSSVVSMSEHILQILSSDKK